MDEILLQKELRDRQYTFVFGILCIALCALFKTIAPMIFWFCWWFEGFYVYYIYLKVQDIFFGDRRKQ